MPEDDEVFLAEEQPLPAAASPTDQSPGYIPESDPEEDPEEDDEDPEEDLADYPADRDDDDEEEEEDPSGDDAEDEDKDDDEEEDEHLALADSVLPALRVIARISIQDEPPSISLPPREEVERLLALTTPPSSPLTPLSSPLPQIPSPLLLLLLPILVHISSPPTLLPSIDHRADRPEICLPPRKRICCTQGPGYEIGESSSIATARPTGGHRANYGFVGTMDIETRQLRAAEVDYRIRDTWVDPREVAEEVAPITFEGVNTRMTELAAVQEQDTWDIYAVIEDTQDRQTQIYQTVGTLVDDSQYHFETARLLDQEALVSREAWGRSLEISYMAPNRRSQTMASEMAVLRIAYRTRQEQLVQTLTLMQSLRGRVTTLLGHMAALQG
ncbi:hypothetical protein Tco_1515545 [Tanacetum coccineum]